jgi:sulfide:quinone oxidoreductase
MCKISEMNPAIAHSPARLVIVGGGVAALEAMLALRAIAGERVEAELHAPEREFAYRPPLVGKPFGAGGAVELDLDGLARRAGAAFYRDKVVAVEPDRRQVVVHDGERVSYDYLLLCPGAEPRSAVPGAETFLGVGDEGQVSRLVRHLETGEVRRLVFAVPGGVSWSLPIYEMALMARSGLAGGVAADAGVTVLTPEERPLAVFGVQAAEQVRALLDQRGVELIGGVHPVEFEAGRLRVAPGDPIEADAVVAAPRLEGRLVEGVPGDEHGFIEVDEHNRVFGLERVFAAGDVTTFPVKQGGLAAQEADAVAETIAAELGVLAAAQPFDPILRAVLWTGARPRYLDGMLSGGHGETSVFSEEPLWEREGKIVGQYLAPFLSSIPGAEQPGDQTGARP